MQDEDGPKFACIKCETEVEEHLIGLGGQHGLYATLINMGSGAFQVVASGRSDRSASKVDAPAPLNVSAVSLTASGGVLTTLKFWVNTWHADPARGFQPVTWPAVTLSQSVNGKLIRGQLDIAIDKLLASLSWATEYRSDFGPFRDDVTRLVNDCRRVIDPTDPESQPVPKVRVGHCPTVVDGVPCRHVLVVKLGAVSIRCPKCATTWPRAQWPQLAKHL